MKEIVISYYDSGIFWSVASGNYHYDRYNFTRTRNKNVRELCEAIENDYLGTPLFINMVKTLFPSCVRLIICENGDIEIIHFKKGERKND